MSTNSHQPWTSGIHGSSRRSRRRRPVPLRSVVAIAIVVALVAGTIGYLIGHRTPTVGKSTTSALPTTATSLSPPSQATATIAALADIDRSQTVVVVANGSGVKGAAAAATKGLDTLGYKTLPAANISGTATIAISKVFYAAGGETAAAHVVSELHLTNIVASPIPAASTEIPVPPASRKNAIVVVIIGTDLASSIAGTPPPTGATTTVAGSPKATLGSAPSATGATTTVAGTPLTT